MNGSGPNSIEFSTWSYSDAHRKAIFWNPDRNSDPYSVYYSKVDVFSISVDALSAASAVPEPANWAMLLVGFGMVGGAAARYRRGKTTATCA